MESKKKIGNSNSLITEEQGEDTVWWGVVVIDPQRWRRARHPGNLTHFLATRSNVRIKDWNLSMFQVQWTIPLTSSRHLQSNQSKLSFDI